MKSFLSGIYMRRTLWIAALLGTIFASVARAQNFTTSNFAINGQVMGNMGTYYASPGQTITFSGTTHDDDGDLYWGIFFVNGPNLPGWNALTPVNISGTDANPSESWTIPNTPGTYAATWRAMDSAGNYDSNGGSFMVYIAVLSPMQPPTAGSNSYTIPVGVPWNGPVINIPPGNGTGTALYCVAGPTPWISGSWTPNSTGTYQLYVGQKADSTHMGNANDPVQGNMEVNGSPYSLTVTAAGANFSLSPTSFTYDGTTKSVSVVPNPSSATYSVTSGVLSATNAGTYNVTITGTGNYTGTSNVSWTINPASVSFSFGGATYDGTTKTVSVGSSPGGVSYSLSQTTSAVNAGSYPVTAASTNPNYSGTTNGSWSISPANATFSFSGGPYNYDGTTKSVSVSVSPGGVSYSQGGTWSAVGSPSSTSNYTATASAYGNYTGSGSYNWSIGPLPSTPPSFTLQPQNQAGNGGGNASFSTAVAGNPAPSVQWQRKPYGSTTWSNVSNGGAYSGATTTTLTITGLTGAMSGDQFQCVASNSAGGATSNTATLTVATQDTTNQNQLNIHIPH